MLFKPLIGAELSGSLGGIVASHNKGGAYFRVRSVPVNPNTPFQQVIRTAQADLTVRWTDNLTQVQRDAWITYAENVELPNRIGAMGPISGLSMYVRSNVSRAQTGLPRQDAAPIIFNLGGFTAPTINAITGSTDLLSLNFTVTDDWVNEDDSAMLVYTSRPQNETVVFFKGPYRFAALIAGDLAIPPTSPADIALAFGATAGQRVFIRVIVSRADGRLSADFRDFDAVV
jgi:hypothetical protein